MVRVALVGHGPGLLEKSQGGEIDDHDKVVRLKQSRSLLENPDIYGSQVDYVVGSFVVGDALQNHWGDLCHSYFLFIDSRTENVTPLGIADMADRFHGECVIDKELCEFWMHAYRQNRQTQPLEARQEAKGKISDDMGHLHPSAGTFAIAYILEYLCPDELKLFGFDNVLSGEFNWSVTRGEDWDKYPDHNWNAENRLLNLIATYYNYTLTNDTFKAVTQ